MSWLRYPNESKGYPDARAALLKQGLRLPVGQRWESWKELKFSELFADKDTLLLYSFMFGPNWDKACASCTSLVDGSDRTWYHHSRRLVCRNC